MARIAERSQVIADDYLAWERQQPMRHEFFRGEVFAMAGGSMRHNALCGAMIEVLRVQLRGRCAVMTSDQRVVAARREHYVYPDVSVVCGPVFCEPGHQDVLANPVILVEVLSAATEQYDRGLKWLGYQQIESLTDYLLVSQSVPQIEHYHRARHRAWTYQVARAGERLSLSPGVEVSVDAIYADVMQLPGE